MHSEKIEAVVSKIKQNEREIYRRLTDSKQPVQAYLSIQKRWDSGVDISEDTDFQRLYSRFYQLRFRMPDHQQIKKRYFSLLQAHRNQEVNEAMKIHLLQEFERVTQRIELSFISKLCHTIDNQEVIYDSVVRKNLGLPTNSRKNSDDKIRFGLGQLNEIASFYAYVLANGLLEDFLPRFNSVAGWQDSRLTNVKKLDFIVWQMRTKKQANA